MKFGCEFESRAAQSRRSRAGSTMEKAIGRLLDLIDIPHEKPSGEYAKVFAWVDFLIPSVQEALDRPDASVFISSKRTTRERWKQVISERARNYVYLIVHDPSDISLTKVDAIESDKIILYVYDEIKEEHYQDKRNVRKLNDLPRDLERFRRSGGQQTL